MACSAASRVKRSPMRRPCPGRSIARVGIPSRSRSSTCCRHRVCEVRRPCTRMTVAGMGRLYAGCAGRPRARGRRRCENRRMTMYLTGDPAADDLLEHDDLALLLGMLLDQQVTMESAFAGPGKMRHGIGAL